jgi:UDP-2,3-diacylglucosamine pyrophosphatase LpxH
VSLTLILPDIHLPYEDKYAVNNIFDLVNIETFDRIVQVGDLLDVKAPARWSRGKAEEYINSLGDEAEAGRQFWWKLRQAAGNSTELVWLRGNHEARLSSYVNNYAPALKSVVPSWRDLMDLDKHNVLSPAQPWKIAPGTIGIHGNLLAPKAGFSAHKEMVRHGQSIIQGHTHRLGVIHENTDRQRFALEAGWLGDIRKATYLDFPGVANWTTGFGYLHVDGKRVTPGVVQVHERGRFTFHGRTYGN